MQVMVVRSPYRSVKRGAIGKVLNRKFRGPYEVWLVLFQKGESWLFRPYELKVLSD